MVGQEPTVRSLSVTQAHATVNPTLLAAVSDVAHPGWRASTVGVYRLWARRVAPSTTPP